jgi:hypothetical protein
MGAVRGRHVRIDGGEAAPPMRAGVARNAVAAHEQLHAAGGQPRLQLLTHQRVRHDVAVAVDLDVVVHVHFDGLEARELVATRWQRSQRRAVDLGKHAGAAAGQLLERPVVQRWQQRGDRPIDLGHALEAQLTQPRQDPARDDLYR